jgi:hypothetical protein
MNDGKTDGGETLIKSPPFLSQVKKKVTLASGENDRKVCFRDTKNLASID